jgi:AcrR family transcriptional regulator
VPRKSNGVSPSADGSDSKSARTRKRILDSAAYVLSRKGYSGTRLGDVADHAELQAPAIYYYFPSREMLIEEVMWVGTHHIRENVATEVDGLPSDATPMDRIMKAVEAHLRNVLELSDYTKAAIRNAGQLPDKIRNRQLVEETKYGALWRRLINEAAAAGELRSDLEPRIARMLIVGALNWAAEWWDPKRGSLDTVVRTAQSMVRHGLSGSVELPSPEQPAPRRKTRSRRAQAT